jgi:hypothetical protein
MHGPMESMGKLKLRVSARDYGLGSEAILLAEYCISGKGTYIPRILNGGEVVPASPCNAHSTL